VTAGRWLRFAAKIELRGINPYVTISAARARTIQPEWRRPMPVQVRINGHPRLAPWRINLMPMGGGAFYLYLHGSVRTASSTGVGDRVTVAVRFDPDYRGGPGNVIPAWFLAGLQRTPPARAAWQQLTPSRQKEIVRYLANLKTAAARDRNLARALGALAGSEKRFMARNW
jgi:hypothetical protein